MKITIMKICGVRFAVLPWDAYQVLVVPISSSPYVLVNGEIKIGESVFQVWNARTYCKSTVRGCKRSSVRAHKVGKKLAGFFLEYWFGGGATAEEDDGENFPDGGCEEFIQKELRKLWMLEEKEPL